jgi:protein-L-isoaspartate(D-aspartate) O-methyltransferase
MNRADFIPDVIWVLRDNWYVPLSRSDDPDRWLELVNSDTSIVTQVDNGQPRGGVDKGIFATSSSSFPRVMTKMLDLLDLHAGMDVLEIGAGTGYNAALMAERAAPGQVITVELDPATADHARTALEKAGSKATVITGDGTVGYPDAAPYERVMATVGARTVPYSWVEQTRPGGRIVVPFVSRFYRQAFLRLDVSTDGSASGKFDGSASFMRLRDQQDDEAIWRIGDVDDASVTRTRRYPIEPFEEFEAGFAVGLLLPDWVMGRRKEDGGTILRMSHLSSGSWATVTPKGDGEYEVLHEGPRRLWEELDAACRWWVDAGRPDHRRFGLTVTKEGQDAWLDSPDQIVPT